MSSDSGFYLNMVEADNLDKPFPAAEHLGEQDITEMDAPGEEVEEELPMKTPPKSVPAKRKPGRPPKNPNDPSKPEPTSPLAITSTVRRRPTQAEREEAKLYADDANEKLQGKWLDRNTARSLKAKRDQYRAIETGGFIEPSSPVQPPSKPTPRKRYVPQLEDDSEHETDDFGNIPEHRQFLERKRQKYVDDHPEWFKSKNFRRERDDDSGDEYLTKRAKKQKQGQKGRDNDDDSELNDYEDVDRYNDQIKRSVLAKARSVLRPPSSTPKGQRLEPGHYYPTGQAATSNLRRKGQSFSSLPYGLSKSQPQESSSSSRPPSRPKSQAQGPPRSKSAFEHRLSNLASGKPANPGHYYPPGFDTELEPTTAFSKHTEGDLESTMTFGEHTTDNPYLRAGEMARRPGAYSDHTTARQMIGPSVIIPHIYEPEVEIDTEEDDDAGEGAREDDRR